MKCPLSVTDVIICKMVTNLGQPVIRWCAALPLKRLISSTAATGITDELPLLASRQTLKKLDCCEHEGHTLRDMHTTLKGVGQCCGFAWPWCSYGKVR